jgi:hypothetical protein
MIYFVDCRVQIIYWYDNSFMSSKSCFVEHWHLNTVEPLLWTPLGLINAVLNWEVSWLQRSNWMEITNLGLKFGVLAESLVQKKCLNGLWQYPWYNWLRVRMGCDNVPGTTGWGSGWAVTMSLVQLGEGPNVGCDNVPGTTGWGSGWVVTMSLVLLGEDLDGL